MTTKAAIYTRISHDATGEGLGVARQLEDCEALRERLGWQVVERCCDNDASAYSRKPRPAWLQLLKDIEAGAVDAIACWHTDRLTRSISELEGVIDLAEQHGLEVAAVTAGNIDLSTPSGPQTARIGAVIARGESEYKAQRQNSTSRQRAVISGRRRCGRRAVRRGLLWRRADTGR